MGRASNNQRDPAGGSAGSTDKPAIDTSGDDSVKVAVAAAENEGLPSPAPADDEELDAAFPSEEEEEEGEEEEDGLDADQDAPAQGYLHGTVAKGRTVIDIDGKRCKAGEKARVPADDYGRLLELGFLARPERKLVAPAKKGPSVTRGG